MKKSMAVITAFIIGISYCPPGMAAMAAEKEKDKNFLDIQEICIPKENADFFHTGEKESLNEPRNFLDTDGIHISTKDLDHGEGERTEDGLENIHKKMPKDVDGADTGALETNMSPELKNLQIPQKFEVVIDPWELDGKSQIYSEQYTIKNTGETAGELTLSGLTCRPQENSGVTVKGDKTGLHDNEEKSVYMEMLFGNGEQIVLSGEKTEYTVSLNPGGELTVWFAGEVNEYASKEWKDGDVTVGVVYSWDEKEAPADADAEEKEESASGAGIDESEEIEEPGIDRDKSGLPEEEPGDNEEGLVQTTEESRPGIDEAVQEADESGEEAKIIDLQRLQKSKLDIKSWTADEKGRIVSEEYILQNTGEEAGILTLSDLTCNTLEESGITVWREKEKLYEDEGKAVCMEMETGKGESIALSTESGEDTGYEVEIKPGEEFSVRFAGEMKGLVWEDLKDGDIEATVICSWASKEAASE